MTTPASPTTAQRDCATAWLVRLDQGNLSQAERQDFRRWLDADPRHAQALQDAQALWQALDGPAHLSAARHATELAPLVAAGRRRRRVRHVGWALGACAAALATLLVLVPRLPELGGLGQDLRADFRTPHGHTRTLPLADGSTVTLAANSAIAIRMDDSQRRVTLLRGEAFFEVKGGLPQPFIVESGEAWARVIGTAFDIRRDGEAIQVAVAHGVVDVGGRPEAGSQRLSAGKGAEIVAGRPGAARDVDLNAATAWKSGQLVFYRQDLAEVLARLEQQRPGRIMVTDPALAARKISGAFPAADVDGTIAAIADTLGCRSAQLGPWLTVLY